LTACELSSATLTTAVSLEQPPGSSRPTVMDTGEDQRYILSPFKAFAYRSPRGNRSFLAARAQLQLSALKPAVTINIYLDIPGRGLYPSGDPTCPGRAGVAHPLSQTTVVRRSCVRRSGRVVGGGAPAVEALQVVHARDLRGRRGRASCEHVALAVARPRVHGSGASASLRSAD